MNLIRALKLVARDLKSGPRSPVFLFAILMPLLITFMLKVVFMSLLTPKPRFAVADLGRSEITAAVEKIRGIELIHTEDGARLRKLVEQHKVDAGIVLKDDFDAEVRAGARPPLEFFISGESLASNRILLIVTALDLVRGIEGRDDPIEVVIRNSGEGKEAPPISVRIVPAILLIVMSVAGIFIPAFMIVNERERRTLHALLVTPVRMSEVLLSKALIGVVMVIVMSLMTLALNQALGGEVLGLLLSMAAAAVMCVETGLIYGTTAKDGKTLYTLIKSLNILLIGPVVFYLFPNWPQWPAKIFPTYWFIDPIYRISMQSAALADVKSDLFVALLICLALVPIIGVLGKRLQIKLAST